MVIARVKGGWGKVEEGKGVINSRGKRFDLGGACTLQYADDVLGLYT